MGQFALGLRSLLVKAAVFVVMAALLAWALGGTLFPRPETARFDGVLFAGERWFWELAVGGRKSGEVRWRMMIEDEKGEISPLDSHSWAEVSGPVVADDSLYYAGRASLNPAEPWRIEQVSKSRSVASYPMPDRLAVELQLARLAAGLPIQDAATMRRQRPLVLDPPLKSADQ